MNHKIYKLTTIVLFLIFLFLVVSLSNRSVKTSYVDKYLNNKNVDEHQFILNFLESIDVNTLNVLGIKQSDVVNDNLSNYNINIISKKTDNYYIILHNKNNNNDREYLTVFKRGLLTYKKHGTPIELNNIIDIFILPVKTDEKYIIFARDLVGFKTSPLDLTSNLHAFVFNKNKKDFTEAIKIAENIEEYQIQGDETKSLYKKFRTKSDILLTNKDYPIMEVLTHYYEAVSSEFDNELTGTPPYSLDFDVVKTNDTYEKYFYDSNFYHFILGYLSIDETEEIVGVIKKNSKVIDNNFKDTYTIIRRNGEVFEIFSDFTILYLN